MNYITGVLSNLVGAVLLIGMVPIVCVLWAADKVFVGNPEVESYQYE